MLNLSNEIDRCQAAVRRRRRDRIRTWTESAFTLVELLVVIAIIGILTALVLPAVQAARESTRRTQCTTNIKQQALAMHTFHNARSTLPIGHYDCCWGTWQIVLLPYLEESATFSLYVNLGDINTWPMYFQGANLTNVTSKRLSVATCPSDEMRTENGMAKHNYIVNYGTTGMTFAASFVPSLAGVLQQGAPFLNRVPVPFSQITDGLSNTLLVTETVQTESVDSINVDVRGVTWWGDGAGFSTYLTPNSTSPDVTILSSYCQYPLANNPPCVSMSSSLPEMYGARSQHPGGVNVGICDGSVRFVADEIEVTTWRALSTTQGGEIVANEY